MTLKIATPYPSLKRTFEAPAGRLPDFGLLNFSQHKMVIHHQQPLIQIQNLKNFMRHHREIIL